MAITKSYVNPQGVELGFHKVGYVQAWPDSCFAAVQSWVDATYQATFPMTPVAVQQIPVPAAALNGNPILDVEQWLITDPSSPLVGGVIA